MPSVFVEFSGISVWQCFRLSVVLVSCKVLGLGGCGTISGLILQVGSILDS